MQRHPGGCFALITWGRHSREAKGEILAPWFEWFLQDFCSKKHPENTHQMPSEASVVFSGKLRHRMLQLLVLQPK